MKYVDCKNITINKNGFRYVKKNVMIGFEKPCLICKTLTKYIDICSEGHFCSDECMVKFYKLVAEQEK